MGFFDDMDEDEFAEIPDDPFFLPESTYPVRIVSAITKRTNDNSKNGLNIKAIISETEFKGRNLNYWLLKPEKLSKAEKDALSDEDKLKRSQAFSRLKKFFIALGFGLDEIRNIDDPDLLGREAKFRTRNTKNGDQTNIGIVAIYPIIDEDEDNDELGDEGEYTDYVKQGEKLPY